MDISQSAQPNTSLNISQSAQPNTSFNISQSAREVLEKRYLARDEDDHLVEDVEGMFRRVAKAVAAAEAKYNGDVAASEERFFQMMTALEFLPNSPTLMNAGRPLGQLSACFVLPVGDSMEEIFDAVKNAALIHKSGGGTGFSFSRLRPTGSPVKSTGGVASGPVSFMKVFNAATEAVKQGGTRRGANMGILRVDHPDIEEFIRCKHNNADFTNFNISVGLTEDFMEAVEKGSDYELVDPYDRQPVKTLNAAAVFDSIVDAAWQNGEPGIIFLDRLNRDNVVPSLGQIEATNPCGEQPLLPYESCNLGSIDLSRMLRQTENTQTDNGQPNKQYDYEVDWEKLAQTVADAVHFLDNVIEINDYPLAAIAEATLKTRKIGLGVMGFADMLLKLGLPYASEEALNLAERVMAFISTAGRQASQQLADKRGAFPLFGESNYAQAGIEPLRNATVTTIAPTGTLSIIAGCSSGVEPVFAYVFIRRIMDGQEFVEVNPALHKRLEKAGIASEELMRKIAEAGSITDIEEIPVEIRRIFLCAHDISPEYHIRMQAAFQRHTDNAVSKTVNFTATASTEDIAEVFRLAYREGCKGVTIYRDGSRESQVLSIKGRSPGETDAGTEPVSPVVIQTDALLQNFGEIRPRPRPVVTSGFTERMKTGCGNLYITVNFDENGICEVFTSTGKAGGCPSQSEAAARLTSIALRSGISVEEVCAQLKGIRCPSTIRQDNMSCTSCPDAIAKVVLKVHRHIKSGGPLTANAIPPTPLLKRSDHRGAEVNGQRSENDSIKAAASEATITTPVNQASLALPGQIEAFCPDCSMRLEHEGGCAICRNCGYSKCR